MANNKQETMIVAGRKYPIVGYAIHPTTGRRTVPMLDIPMMSEYRMTQKYLEMLKSSREKYGNLYYEDAEIEAVSAWLRDYEEKNIKTQEAA